MLDVIDLSYHLNGVLSVGVSSTGLNEREIAGVFVNLIGNYWIIVR